MSRLLTPMASAFLAPATVASGGPPAVPEAEPVPPVPRPGRHYGATRRTLFSFTDLVRHERSGVAWRIVKENLSGVTGTEPRLSPGPR